MKQEMPQMSVQQVAQAMLDRYGFFVVCPATRLPIGHIFSSLGQDGTTIEAKCVVVAEATEQDLRNQHAVAGRPFEYHGSPLYRAVAE
jgi:hypothetical protein